MTVREIVSCSQCGNEISRVVWNYGKSRPIKEFFCDTSCKGSWQVAQRESLGFTKEFLIEEYIVKEKSANQIGKEIGRDAKSVWRWMVDYGIETRPRGHNPPPLTGSGKDNPFYGKKHSDETKQKIREVRLKDGLVPCIKDGVHWMHHEDYTQEDHPKWKGGLSPERQVVYSSPEWKECVKYIWGRDKAICQRCGKHHNENRDKGSFHIHHIVSFQVEEKRTDVDNLILVCRDCHYWIHSNKNTDNEFIKEIDDGTKPIDNK